MASFTGTHYYTLDPKGRVIIPAPLREILAAKYSSSKIYITNSPFDKCLHIFPEAEWAVLEDKLKDLPSSSQAVQFFKRRVFSAAVLCEPDKNGRIMVPYELRQNASITDDVVVVGLMDRIELWDRKLWDKVANPDNVDIESFRNELSEYGL